MAVGVIADHGQVLQRLAEQIIEDAEEEETFKIFFQDKVGFNNASWSRTAVCGSGGAVLRREEARAVLTSKPGHSFFEPQCIWQSRALEFMRQLRRLLEEFPASSR